MSVLVPMNVRCIGEECIGCEDLQIDNDQYVFSNGVTNNKLFCKNYGKCERIKEHILHPVVRESEEAK